MKKFYLFIILLVSGISVANTQSILLVNDNAKNPERVDALKSSLENLEYTYSYFDAVGESASPTAEFLAPYDLVIWYTGNDGADLYLWNGDETDNEDLKSYLDDGGMLWLQGLDFLYDKYGSAADTFYVGDFVYDYLGFEQYVGQSHVNDGVYSDGVEFLEVVPDNGIFTLDSIKWVWSTLWYGDAILPTSSASPLYNMAPLAYDFGGLSAAVFNEKDDAKIMSFTIETAKFDAAWRLDSLFAQGLRYFKQFASTSTLVESVSISTESGNDFIDVKGGSLQFKATILPEDATNKNVEWVLENNTANASIDANGLLSASGVSNGNGTVTVVGKALDGSGVSASMEITISNQGEASDYEILLVNDNANGTDRYLVLETALSNNEYNYSIYNTVQTSEFPDLDFLSVFDVVIWYTGNDGVDLKLWDVSDSTDIKFNAPLKGYLDNGGIVWLQGLDFLYDVFGSAPFPEGNDDFQAGSFIYDYMGIKKYVAQAKADDGGLGVSQLDIVPDNPICELSPVFWAYSTMWYVDALAITDNAQGVYKLGPNDYVFNPFYAGVYNRLESKKSKLLTFTFETARLDNQDNTDQLFYEVLESFEGIVANTEDTPLLHQTFEVFPNPTDKYLTISYELENKSNVSIKISSIFGNKVISTPTAVQSKGKQTTTIDINIYNLPAGNYYVSLIINNKISTKKLIVVE